MEPVDDWPPVIAETGEPTGPIAAAPAPDPADRGPAAPAGGDARRGARYPVVNGRAGPTGRSAL